MLGTTDRDDVVLNNPLALLLYPFNRQPAIPLHASSSALNATVWCEKSHCPFESCFAIPAYHIPNLHTMPAKNYPSDLENGIDSRDANTESGYVSGGSSDDYVPEIVFTKPHLQFLNRQLQFLEPQGMFDIAFSPASLEPRFCRTIRV
jgi:hypothetical protein